MERLSLYEFGGSERHVRRAYRRFVRHYRGRNAVLDVGCGRGTFLDLLRASDIPASGIDPSSEAIEACRRRGHNAVIQADAHSYLASHTAQFDGIFCSHVIEHLSPDSATTLITLVLDALMPGGVAIFVTPNSDDLGVVAGTFWLDITHVRPYPLPLLMTMLRQAGFSSVHGGHYGVARYRDWPVRVMLRVLLAGHYARENSYAIAWKALKVAE